MKALKILGIGFFGFLAFVGISQRNVPGGENNIVMGVICLFIVILISLSFLFSGKKKRQVTVADSHNNFYEEASDAVENTFVHDLQQTVLFLTWCEKNTRFLPEGHYPDRMKTEWGIENPSQFHHNLLRLGYLDEMSLEQRIRSLKVVELKQLLKEMDLPVSGRKNDLIQRILENGDFDSILGVIGEQPEFYLTEKAYQLFSDYADMTSFGLAIQNLQGYQADGVEKYQILATLDSKTCEFCGSMDGKIFSVSTAMIGKNMPPFHSECRCTTTPYYDDTDLTDMTRAARDPETGKTYKVPADMTYEEWKKTIQSHRR